MASDVSVVLGTAEMPNFVVLFADDLGYGDLSIAGHPTISTPNLDRLASEGVRYTQWYSAFHICSPSRAAMLTGRLPIRSGVTGDYLGGVFSSTAIGGLPLDEITWAQTLKSKDYRTMCIGKWHLGQRPEYLPTRRGFDAYLGLPYSVDMGNSAWRSTDQPPLPLMANETVIEQPVDLNTLTQRYVTAAKSFISVSAERFALYYAFSHVHVPDFASPAFCNTSLRGRYGDAVAELDWSVGQLLFNTSLNNTLTFFTSDNGPWLIQQLAGGSAGIFFEGKTTTWEGGIREPAILHWPGVVPPNQRRSALVSTCDVFSTILAAAGVSEPSDRVIDGMNLAPTFHHDAQLRNCIFIYKGRPGACDKDGGDTALKDDCPGLWAIRCGKYKAHYASVYSQASCTGAHNISDCSVHLHNPPMLFDLEADPSEKWPLDPVSYADKLNAIAAAKQAHEEELGTPPPDQIMLGSDAKYAVCGCPNSTLAYPAYPNCTCSPANWDVSVCSPIDDDLYVDGSSSPEFYHTPDLSYDAYAYADAFEKQYGWRPW